MKPLSYRAIIVAAVCGAAAALMVNSVMLGAGFTVSFTSWADSQPLVRFTLSLYLNSVVVVNLAPV